MLVYLITNRINGKKYVGQTIRTLKQRWSNHVVASKHNGKCAISKAINKYGEKEFFVEVLRVCKSREELNKFEVRLIKQLGTLSPHGYNLTTGGTGPEPTEATKKKQSMAKLGMHLSPKTEFKVGVRVSPKTEFKVGVRVSPATEFKKGQTSCNKGKVMPRGIDSPWFGRKHSASAKRKMRMAKLGKPRAPGTWMEPFEWKHGTSYGYKEMKCRCNRCRKYRHDLHVRTGQ